MFSIFCIRYFFSIFCHFDILRSIFYQFDILRSIFCHFDILFSIFATLIFCFDILPLRYFVFDILPLRYVVFRYFATSICCLSIFCLSLFCPSIFCFSIFCPSIFYLSIFCPSIFCVFDILLFDIMQYDVLLIRYFACSIPILRFDILRLRYSAISIFCDVDILSFDILRSIFCDSIFCVSIFCHGSLCVTSSQSQRMKHHREMKVISTESLSRAETPSAINFCPGNFVLYRVSQNYPNMYFSTIIATALKPLKMWIPKFYELLIKRQSEMPHASEVPSWPRSVTISGCAEELLFPFCPSTKQAIIDKGHNPRFHNRAIGMKFAREPVNRVRNQLDISRIHIFQQLR